MTNSCLLFLHVQIDINYIYGYLKYVLLIVPIYYSQLELSHCHLLPSVICSMTL